MSGFLPMSATGPSIIELTPERVAVLSLIDCAEQLERSASDTNRLAFAAKSAHLALQAALTAALAGTANIGAHAPKLRSKHLKYLEDCREGCAEAPESDRVMSFSDLLDAATKEPLPWTGTPVTVSSYQLSMLDRLTAVRNAVEHPKQHVHSIEPRYVAEAIPVAAVVAFELLKIMFHHLEDAEITETERAVRRIESSSQEGL